MNRHYVGGTLFLFASVLFCWYWTAFPLNHVRFTHEYPQMGLEPGPGPLKSSRYGLEWWLVWVLGLNWLLPYAWGAALLHSNYTEVAKLHLFVSRVALLLNLLALAVLSVSWFFLCNHGYVPYSTACNDLRWCCVNFPSDWCPNVGPCTPDVLASDLVRTGEFFQMWLFSLLFFLWALAHRTVNVDLRDYGVFVTGDDNEWPARKALNEE
jgi:hypothetical protein